ncbi:uncharacterized protein CTRU02_207491 [Colletotrichum truncatum]|uniref:Uncharacterized protein n=1 Tax=Colletotrichum truncatum TaxID=5467 RepID=A0ACC3Z0Z2_COLTU|nr:uncharacterized protein CTRU02_00874 [Colletotrichum truncatum]KAF6800469.1 hypothetical protein CTRU02_00874 [Colletotrichum truncatum]
MQDTQLAPRAHSDTRCLHFLCYVCFSSLHCAVWSTLAPRSGTYSSSRACSFLL